MCFSRTTPALPEGWPPIAVAPHVSARWSRALVSEARKPKRVLTEHVKDGLRDPHPEVPTVSQELRGGSFDDSLVQTEACLLFLRQSLCVTKSARG